MKQIFNDYLPEGSTNKKEDFIQSYQVSSKYSSISSYCSSPSPTRSLVRRKWNIKTKMVRIFVLPSISSLMFIFILILAQNWRQRKNAICLKEYSELLASNIIQFHKLSLFFVDQASPVQADPYCWSVYSDYSTFISRFYLPITFPKIMICLLILLAILHYIHSATHSTSHSALCVSAK